uniref:HTH psq-type domain-containing protein n=1 Tax=Elaeophora elaphi TaxID=1147741 RepID=A0A0R3RXZ1_9BILA
MDMNRANIGNIFIESSITDMAERFQQSDSLNATDLINTDDCDENAMNGQKISVALISLKIRAPENGNVVNSVGIGKNDKESSKAITNDQVDEKLRRAIDIVVGYSRVSDETKERLKSAVTDVHCKTMSEQEACQRYKLAVSYFRTYYNMVEKLLNRANLIREHRSIISAAEENGMKINVKNEGVEVSSVTSNDVSIATDINEAKDGKGTPRVRGARKNFTQDISAIDKKRIDRCIYEFCGTSARHSTKADAIRKAVGMVLHEGCTGVEAARATNLTPRTVMKHAYVVRDVLNLPQPRKTRQQTVQKNEGNEMKAGSFLAKVTDNDREIAKMLINDKFGCVEDKDFSGTGLELESKIDKLLREFSYNGDIRKIREAIIKIFTEQKSSEIYKAITELPVTVVSSYVRLLKGFLWAENMMKTKDAVVAIPRRGRRRLFDDAECNDVKSAELVKPLESDRIFSAKKKRKSANLSPRGVFIGKIDVLTLHQENGVENEEQLIKSVISYLIDHQYRRSETAQTNMQICLEHILLDGLSVTETLKIHDGPNENILEVYHKRCRDAFTALTVDFPAFVVKLSLLNEDEKSRSRKKRSRMSNVKMEEIKTIDMSNVDNFKFGTVEKLFISIPEKALALLHSYIMKLLHINFPLEKRLVSGLLQMIGEKMAKKYMLDDKLLEDCIAYFYDKHNNIAP